MPKPKLVPDRQVELSILADLQKNTGKKNPIIAGVDEVGRGALAGPASVGITLISPATVDSFPSELRDSKLLSPRVRQRLIHPVTDWVLAGAVGHSTIAEINNLGIITALRMAATRACAQLREQGFAIDAVLLDGSHNWWSEQLLGETEVDLPAVPVTTMVKGDAKCAVVAAASVLAKVERDTLLEKLHLEFPQYDWQNNKGYSSPKHIVALKEYGASIYHRTAWKLPGLTS